MKLLFALVTLATFSAHASPLMSVKERLRLHMWTYGLQEKQPQKVRPQSKQLPEELERSLRKI